MRRRAKVLVAPVLGLALTGYFAYHLVEGDRGLRAWMRTTPELRLAKAGLADVAAERAKLERRAADRRGDHNDRAPTARQVRRQPDGAAHADDAITHPPAPRGPHRATQPRTPPG